MFFFLQLLIHVRFKKKNIINLFISILFNSYFVVCYRLEEEGYVRIT